VSPPRLSALSTGGNGKRGRPTTTGGDESLGATPRPSTASQLNDASGSIPEAANPIVDLRRRAPSNTVATVDVLKGFREAMAAATTAADVMRVHYDVASFLTNDVVVAARNAADGKVKYYRVAEVELYVTHKSLHNDPFTHADPLQRESGLWYFHRKGGSFKAGSFKGLDVTYGTPQCPCGALIRSLVRMPRFDDAALKGSTVAPVLSSPMKEHLIDGPSLVVDELLSACGAKDIAALVANQSARMPVDSAALTLQRAVQASPRAVVRGRVMLAPRVGLIPREAKTIGWAARLLRFVTPDVACHMKHRGGLVAGALAVYRLRLAQGSASVAPVELAAMLKRTLATRGDVDGWSECETSAAAEPSDATAAEKKDVIGSSKLNTAPGAAGLVRAGLRRGALAATFETLGDITDDLLGF